MFTELLAVGILVNLNSGHSRRVTRAWATWYKEQTPENARNLALTKSRVRQEYLVIETLLGIFVVGNVILIAKTYPKLRATL